MQQINNMSPNIRNFAIIAHIDHGKSTLADRLMEMTGTVDKHDHDEQMLDRNPISRERGITIKLAPVRMKYSCEIPDPARAASKQVRDDRTEYILNLIDTPGHVDFSYEVDRTLACVEGAILLVDATQGIQAQTIANTYKALDKNLTIIPVINKIDMPSAEVEKVSAELVDFLGVSPEEIIHISAKTGQNVDQILQAIITRIPEPASYQTEAPLSGLIFDSYFDKHKGVIAFVRIVEGTVRAGIPLRLAIGQIGFEPTEVGIFSPELTSKNAISAGEIGYVVTNLKDIHGVRVGDTITAAVSTPPLPGYRVVHPMVFASLFPTDPAEYENFKKALEKIYLTDSALEFTSIYSQALGAGYRVGFLGLLHADVVRERLEREYHLNLVITPPQVDYRVSGETYEEPIARIMILCPQTHVGAVMKLCEDHRAQFVTMDNKNQVTMEYEMPLSEMISGFFDKLKSVTSGYASFDWELLRYQPVQAAKMTLLLNGDPVEEFSQIVVKERAQEQGEFLTKRLRSLIPRQQFEVKIQAQYGGRIIASERISAFRKDVLTKGSKTVGGGDYSRKRKLLEKQKEGKKKMKMIGSVEIPKEAFVKLFNES